MQVPPFLPDVPTVREDIASYYTKVQEIDALVGKRIEQLDEMGTLENTLFIVTADHGFAFPRAKTQLYDTGTRVPLAVQWPAVVDGGREVEEFVSLTDRAPTFLEAAGIEVPGRMTGTSLMDVLTTADSSSRSPRTKSFFGLKRHVPCQEEGNCGRYPMRAIRTENHLYIHNFAPDRWPSGTPNYEDGCVEHSWLGNIDNGPAKYFLYANRDDPGVSELHNLSFAKRPREELYDLRQDSHQMNNVAGEPAYKRQQKRLRERLFEEFQTMNDPRVVGNGSPFVDVPYLGTPPQYPDDDVVSIYDGEYEFSQHQIRSFAIENPVNECYGLFPLCK